mmetsp:Transcript_17715/g.50501  ORF Transcript_17715/g.50501 Transcript_17715/m.50501 type:complete len:438 (+) Transcript_17715:40-1353(+)
MSGVMSDSVRRNWHLMSALVGINHGASTTPLIFATTLLCPRVGYAGSGLLSVPVIMAFGQRRSVVLAIRGELRPRGGDGAVGSTAQWCAHSRAGVRGRWDRREPPLDIPGRIPRPLHDGGLGLEGRAERGVGGRQAPERVTAELASTFAMYYLLAEVACKLLSSSALRCEVRPFLVFTACLVAGLLSAAGGLLLLDLGKAPGSAAGGPMAKLAKAAALWSDPALWCLSLTNLTFGFAAAFLNGYVNAAFTKPQLGAEFVGFFATATALSAAVMSQAFGALARRFGTKGPLILIRSLCFLAVPALVLVVGFDGWRYWLIVPYLLQGCGRAVHESTNKGVVADFFPGPQSEGAFANVMMQVTLSFAVCFFFSATFSSEVLAGIVLTLAALTCPFYLLAKWLRQGAGSDCAGDNESTCTPDSTDSARSAVFGHTKATSHT